MDLSLYIFNIPRDSCQENTYIYIGSGLCKLAECQFL